MLKLTVLPEEYITINDNIVIQVARVAGGKVNLAIHADKSIPVVRGKVLERAGTDRPDCLTPPTGKKAKTKRDRVVLWNDDKDRAVHRIHTALERLEQQGATEEINTIRQQLAYLLPETAE